MVFGIIIIDCCDIDAAPEGDDNLKVYGIKIKVKGILTLTKEVFINPKFLTINHVLNLIWEFVTTGLLAYDIK